MQKRKRYPCNIYRRRHHTRGGRVRHTLSQKPSRANFTYTSPLRRRTSTDHNDYHVATLQTVTHARIASIIACSHTRFSTRRLRHRLHTGWANTRTLPLQPSGVDNKHRGIQLDTQACMQEQLKNASNSKHEQQQKTTTINKALP